MTISNNDNNNAPTQWFRLIPESLRYLASRILALQEEDEEDDLDNDGKMISIEPIHNLIVKDLEENAQRLEEMANHFAQLISSPSGYHDDYQDSAIVDYITSKESIIRFALNIYANDVRESKDRIVERLEVINDNNDGNAEDTAFFFNEYCKTDNLNKLLANIEDFVRQDLGRNLRTRS